MLSYRKKGGHRKDLQGSNQPPASNNRSALISNNSRGHGSGGFGGCGGRTSGGGNQGRGASGSRIDRQASLNTIAREICMRLRHVGIL